MKKLNSVIFNKLIVQAQEAKHQSMDDLSEAISFVLSEGPVSDVQEYSFGELKADIYNNLWKIAKDLIIYHDMKSIDAAKLDPVIASWASKIMNELEDEMDIHGIGAIEPKLPGEK